MEIIAVLFTLASIAALGIVSPGPDFLAVTHASFTSTKLHAAFVASGVVLGNAVWAGAALFGVGTLFILFPAFFLIFKVVGGSYLIWMGFRMIRNARAPLESTKKTSPDGNLKGFLRGFSTTMANPKAAIYYASALTTVAPANASFALLSLMVSVVFFVAALWFTVVVLFLSTPKASTIYKSIKTYLEATVGTLIMLFGLKQILSR